MRHARSTIVGVTLAFVVWSLLMAATVPYNNSITTALLGIGGPRPILSPVDAAATTPVDEWTARMLTIWVVGVAVILAIGVAVILVGSYLNARRQNPGHP